MAALSIQPACLCDVLNRSVVQHHHLCQFPSVNIALCEVKRPVRSEREALGNNLLLLFEFLRETRKVFKVIGVLRGSTQVNTVSSLPQVKG